MGILPILRTLSIAFKCKKSKSGCRKRNVSSSRFFRIYFSINHTFLGELTSIHHTFLGELSHKHHTFLGELSHKHYTFLGELID